MAVPQVVNPNDGEPCFGCILLKHAFDTSFACSLEDVVVALHHGTLNPFRYNIRQKLGECNRTGTANGLGGADTISR